MKNSKKINMLRVLRSAVSVIIRARLVVGVVLAYQEGLLSDATLSYHVKALFGVVYIYFVDKIYQDRGGKEK